MIRGSFLDRVQALGSVDSGQLVRLLQALEVVGRGLEADWSQHFADRLSAPDGLELVVEVAHDLRSPLTSILFLAETLQRGRSGPPGMRGSPQGLARAPEALGVGFASPGGAG